MSHYQTVCRKCKTVVEQCRCPSKDKPTTYVEACPSCLAKAKSHPKKRKAT